MYIILHDTNYGTFVAERDNEYIDFSVKYKKWDGNITKNTLMYDSPEMALSIIKYYMVSAIGGTDKEEELKSFRIVEWR